MGTIYPCPYYENQSTFDPVVDGDYIGKWGNGGSDVHDVYVASSVHQSYYVVAWSKEAGSSVNNYLTVVVGVKSVNPLDAKAFISGFKTFTLYSQDVYFATFASGEGYGMFEPVVDYYTDIDNARAALFTFLHGGGTLYPITYRLTNASAPSAPESAAVGDVVNVNFTFPEGYGIVNNSDVYVTNNGVIVPSNYNNGTLSFTMPDPS